VDGSSLLKRLDMKTEDAMEEDREQASQTANGADPFDLNRLRINQDFTETIGVKKPLLTVPVRKPSTTQAFVQVHPDEAYREKFAIFEHKEQRTSYVVLPKIAAQIPGEIAVKMLFTTIDRQGIVSMWPIRLPGPDGRLDAWNRSAFDAAQIAMTRWIRVKANMALGAYEVFEATAPLPDPEWPTHSFRDLVEIAFKDLLIATLDHPVLRTLRGEF
jgi:hypothetical protein